MTDNNDAVTDRTWITDPAPADEDHTRCEMKVYPSPDEVVFCDNPAWAVLIAPCCSQQTGICRGCYEKMISQQWSYWQCHGCGTRHKGGQIKFDVRPA